MPAYYNETDPYAAQWLRNLIKRRQVADGFVDERSVLEICAADLRGYDRVHFFAGIGGWDLALQLAGWPDDRPVWTGSAPCQPFSSAGAGKGGADRRHLWPAWFSLIAQCRPPIIFGEQIEDAIGWGWIDAVFTDLEAQGYACAQAVLPACGVGAPHLRYRTFWVAYDHVGGLPRVGAPRLHDHGQRGHDAARRGEDGGVGDASSPRLSLRELAIVSGALEPTGGGAAQQSGGSPWADCDWLACSDGKDRPAEPGTFPLAYGVSNRVGRLRAYGNAIIPTLAAEFIRAVM